MRGKLRWAIVRVASPACGCSGPGATLVLLALVGVAGGLLVGFLGIGGILYVPALLLAGFGQLDAQATSFLAVLPAAVAGSWAHRRRGHIDRPAALPLVLGSLVGVAAGVVLATALPERVLELLFAGPLVAVAARLVHQAAAERRAAGADG